MDPTGQPDAGPARTDNRTGTKGTSTPGNGLTIIARERPSADAGRGTPGRTPEAEKPAPTTAANERAAAAGEGSMFTPKRPAAADAPQRPAERAGSDAPRPADKQQPAKQTGDPGAASPAAKSSKPSDRAPDKAPNGSSQQQWKIKPLPGEPPLTLYRDKRLVLLPVGTEIDRFGEDSGNVTYAARTQYQHRSLPNEWSGFPYHAYRLQRPVEALTGLAVPWFEQPGGGTAFVLPRSVAELVADGALVEIENPAPIP